MRRFLAVPVVLMFACSEAKPPTAPAALEASDPSATAGTATAAASPDPAVPTRSPRRNQPPVIRLGGPRPPAHAPSNTLYPLAGGQPEDPDGDDPNTVLCPTVRVSASGPCRATLADCGGVGDVFDVDLRTLGGPGICVVRASVRDSWGAVGMDQFRFMVSRR
jgi:hypothetical protein